MADVTITTDMALSTVRGDGLYVWTDASTGYCFYNDGSSDSNYRKTTDGGATWGAAVPVIAATINCIAACYDKDTPGNTGTLIHIIYNEQDADDCFYKSLDTATDTLSSAVTVFAGSSATGDRETFLTIARAVGGNLYAGGTIDLGTENFFYRSVDNGANWTARTDPLEAAGDQYHIYPSTEADTNDVWLVYDDISANELTLKTYDDSGNSFSEASICAFVEASTDGQQYGWSGAIRHSNGHLYLAVTDNVGDAGGDGEFYDINGGGSITAKTNFFTDNAGKGLPAVMVDINSKVWVAYLSGTVLTSWNVVYQTSVDGGASWSGEVAFAQGAAGALRRPIVPRRSARFTVAWRSSANLLTNFVNSVVITEDAGGAGGAGAYYYRSREDMNVLLRR